jgi:pilus assembly protein FimV
MADSSQKFIARNRAPRVQIEYDVELYGAEKKVQLPFVMGVMSDLAGKSEIDQGSVSSRKFLEIDVDNFDDRMASIAPRAAFTVPNTLTGEGSLPVDLTFTKMSDFEPGAIAAKVDSLRPLLEARQQLSNLMTYMDGKAGAEALIEKILGDTALLGALAAGGAGRSDEQTAALDALRAVEVKEVEDTSTEDALNALRAADVPEAAQEDSSAAALDALRAADLPEPDAPDESDAALDALRAVEIEIQPDDSATLALEALRNAPVDETPEDGSDQALAALRALEIQDSPQTDQTADTLDTLRTVEIEVEQNNLTDTALDALRATEVVDAEDTDDTGSALDALRAVELEVAEEDDSTAALDALKSIEIPADAAPDDASSALEALRVAEVPQTAENPADDAAAILAGLDAPEDVAEHDDTDDILAGLDAVEEEDDSDDADDILAGLETPQQPQTDDNDLDDVLAGLEIVEEEVADDTDDILAGLDAVEEKDDSEDADDILAGLETPDQPQTEEDDLDDVLAGLEIVEDEVADDTDDILAGLDAVEEGDSADDLNDVLAGPNTLEDNEDADGDDELDALMAGLDDDDEEEDGDDDLDALLAGTDEDDEEDGGDDDLDALLAGLDDDDEEKDGDDDLDALLAGTDEDDEEDGGDDDLDALLAGLDDDDEEKDGDDDLDALLAGTDEDDEEDGGDDDLDALLAGLDDDDEEDALLAGLDDDGDDATENSGIKSAEPELAYGQMSAARPEPQKLVRKRFRLAILGDFTGRSVKGEIEVGEALANRKPILLDPDTVEDVIKSFGTTLVLPIGKEGAGVEVKLGGLDDLHPDELYENVEIFSALKSLKSQLSNGGTAENAAKSLKAWGEAHGRHVAPASAVSGGNTVRADLKLSDFQKLIGDTGGTLAKPSPVDDLLARIVGPHIRKLPDPNATAMAQAVDDALSGAMRLVLHHPDFQSVEAQWRSIDLIARSIETDDTLEVVLYDISAEEIAADLTQSDDLSQSGFARLLTEGPMDEETGRGAYSAMVGMYTFEETPPHAQLLGRIARVAAHVDAPFFAAMTPGFLETPKADRHPLVAKEWDTLRAMPEAGHLGLASPRFMLRRPYGAKTEPIYEFDFEEFTQKVGLSGMLWANPVVLIAILLAKSFKENGAHMGLGKIMSLGDIPYHYVLDRFGDQVALPCTERNLTLDKVETVLGRGYLPVISIKGRDEVRLGSFQSLAGGDILGPWTGVAPPPPSPPKPPKPAAETPGGDDEDVFGGDDDDMDDLLAGFDLDSFGDDDETDSDDDDIDDDLAALLADL